MVQRGRAGGVSIRQARFAEVVRTTMADIFLRETLESEILQEVSITITDVCMSPDLRYARIFILSHDGGVAGKSKKKKRCRTEEVLQSLNDISPQLRKYLGSRLYARHIPELRFCQDQSFDVAQRVEKALSLIRQKQEVDPA